MNDIPHGIPYAWFIQNRKGYLLAAEHSLYLFQRAPSSQQWCHVVGLEPTSYVTYNDMNNTHCVLVVFKYNLIMYDDKAVKNANDFG